MMPILIEISENELGLPEIFQSHFTDEELAELLFGCGNHRESIPFEEIFGENDPNFEEIEKRDLIKKLLQHANLTDLELKIIQQLYWDELSEGAIAKKLGLPVPAIVKFHDDAIAKLQTLARQWGLY
ncbi:MAG: hypothetical protein RMK89_14580 [Armatimonadota bacterium]|nr:hypothetical protein [Armatimonadota bacterium]MDW8144670.1 hypothetical protein [Armatimonadota bacterium]